MVATQLASNFPLPASGDSAAIDERRGSENLHKNEQLANFCRRIPDARVIRLLLAEDLSPQTHGPPSPLQDAAMHRIAWTDEPRTGALPTATVGHFSDGLLSSGPSVSSAIALKCHNIQAVKFWNRSRFAAFKNRTFSSRLSNRIVIAYRAFLGMAGVIRLPETRLAVWQPRAHQSDILEIPVRYQAWPKRLWKWSPCALECVVSLNYKFTVFHCRTFSGHGSGHLTPHRRSGTTVNGSTAAHLRERRATLCTAARPPPLCPSRASLFQPLVKKQTRSTLAGVAGRVGKSVFSPRQRIEQMDNTESARAVNGMQPPNNFVSLAMRDGGWIPPPGSGAFNLALWGKFLGVEPSTVRKHVRTHRIPYRQLGNDMMIDAEDFLKSIPYANTDPED